MSDRAEPTFDEIAACILSLTARRGSEKTVCPSEVARALTEDWRPLMPDVRASAARLTAAGHIVVTQNGRPIDATTARGPIRLGAR